MTCDEDTGRFSWQSPAQANLAGIEREVFKADRRSRVTGVETAAGPVAIKRFVYRPVKQRLARAIGRHPAQREARWNRRLGALNVRRVEIVATGTVRRGAGCELWLATRLTGRSLQRLLRDPATGRETAAAAVDAAAALTRDLLAAGLTFRDLKPSNIAIDAGLAYLLDVGSVRRSRSPRRRRRMLEVMDRVMRRDGVAEDLRRRYRRQVAGGAD